MTAAENVPQSGPAETGESWAWLAQIRRPQGRKGEVFAEILTDFPEKFAERKRLWLLPGSTSGTSSAGDRDTSGAGSGALGALKPDSRKASISREVELRDHWLHKGGIVLHFAGVDSISEAEKLAGMIVAVPQSERALLAEDEFYVGDLIGCVLADVAAGAATEIGLIQDVDRSAGPVPLLVVENAEGEVLIPFAKSYLRKIDIESKRVEMDLPDGLIEINAPSKSKFPGTA